jgi:hypothetical protein
MVFCIVSKNTHDSISPTSFGRVRKLLQARPCDENEHSSEKLEAGQPQPTLALE